MAKVDFCNINQRRNELDDEISKAFTKTASVLSVGVLRMLKDIHELDNIQIEDMNPDLNQWTISIKDKAERNHNIGIQIDGSYPESTPIFTTQLPTKKSDFVWNNKKRMQDILIQFVQVSMLSPLMLSS